MDDGGGTQWNPKGLTSVASTLYAYCYWHVCAWTEVCAREGGLPAGLTRDGILKNEMAPRNAVRKLKNVTSLAGLHPIFASFTGLRRKMF